MKSENSSYRFKFPKGLRKGKINILKGIIFVYFCNIHLYENKYVLWKRICSKRVVETFIYSFKIDQKETECNFRLIVAFDEAAIKCNWK